MNHKKTRNVILFLMILFSSYMTIYADYPLTSGVPYSDTIIGYGYYPPGSQFYITVPSGATQLQIDLLANPNTLDIDLWASFNVGCDPYADPAVFDYYSTGLTGVESITITASSSPPIQAGNFYITVDNWESTPVPYTITATVSSGPAGDKVEDFFRFTLGADASVTATLDPNSLTADLDLFLFNNTTNATFNELTDVIASSRSSTGGATETITQSLTAGTYFVGVSAFDGGSNSSAYSLTITAGGGGGSIVFDDTFDAGAEGWTFNPILGSSSSTSTGGALKITYNNTSAFSYWRRPLTGADPDIGPLSADMLYRATMNITSTVTASTTTGDIPDFRVATSLANGASQLFFVSSFLSNGGSNFISPTTTPRDYYIYFEATGLPAVQSSPLILQFEGFNFPFGGRPTLIGASIGLNRAELDVIPAYAVNGAGTVVHSISDAAGFNLGSGTANGWAFTSFTTGGNAGATGAKAADNDGLVITSNPLGSGSYVYGSWDANPALGTSIPTFSGGVLYRATFKITTATVASATVNQPIPQVRIQCGDSHVAAAGNLYSAFGSSNNKQLTSNEASTPPIDLWFYYSGATRTGGLTNRIFPAFEILVLPSLSIPNGAALTLRSYELSAQTLP